MFTQQRRWGTKVTAAALLGLFASLPSTFAATTQSTPLTDLTGLANISTTVTGLPDTTFSQAEQAYQQPLTGTSGWRGFNNQGGRDVTLTFAKPVDVRHIEITMLQNPQIGVYFPSYVTFEFESGGQWYSAGQRSTSIPTSGQNVMTQVFQFNSAAGYEADAVRIHIPVAVWVFAQGLRISGSTTLQGQNPSSLAPVPDPAAEVGPLSPDNPSAHGIQNMLLVETGDHGSEGLWSTSDFTPMVGYVDSSGKMISPLFDTMLFLPYGSVSDTEAGWTNYLQDLFADNQQLSALDQAVANSNQALNRPDYKEKVVLSIPYFPYGTHRFGTINGQTVDFGGSSSDPNAVEARDAALEWYVSTMLSQWKAANYTHLQLAGLYWDEEQYHAADPGEASLLSEGVQTAKDNGLPLFWIPYYGANQTDAWSSLGFDAAWIQPNYVEQGSTADVTRISNAMETAKQNGMGIEVELAGLDPSNQQLYNTFLDKLNVEGFGQNQVTHAFYDGSKLLVTAEESTDASTRAVYDSTAAFIDGGQTP